MIHAQGNADRRLTAAALAMLLLSPACITTQMWAGDSQLQTDGLACDCAELVPAGPDAPLQLVLQLDAAAGSAIGATTDPTGDPIWIRMQPDDPPALADLLQRIQSNAVGDVVVEVRFWPAEATGQRVADLRLSAVSNSDLEQPGIHDTPPSRQSRHRLAAYSHCRWQAQSAPPNGGQAMPTPTVTKLDYQRVGMTTPVLLLFTPLTLACDLVLLPFEILGVIALKLAD